MIDLMFDLLPLLILSLGFGYNTTQIPDVTWTWGKPNMGGTAGNIYAVPLQNVAAIPEADGFGIIRDDIQLKPGAKLTTLYHTQETGIVRFERQGEKDGGSCKNFIEWNTPGNEPDNFRFAASVINGPWIFFGYDTDKYLNIVGSIDFGAYNNTLNGTTGQAAADKKGVSYGFDANSPVPPLRYNGNIEDLLVKAPIATMPSNISSNSFDANWNEVEGATSYILDVSIRPDFRTYFVENLEVFALTQKIEGLTPNTTYYYRVRTRENIYLSSNSNVIAIKTA